MITTHQYLAAFDAATAKLLALSPEAKEEEVAALKKTMDEAAKSYNNDFDGAEIYLSLKKKLEQRGSIPIEEVENPDIDTYAKMEYSWTHERDCHRLFFRKGKFVNHRKVRELVKLRFEMDAMDADCHEWFFVTSMNHDRFVRDYLHTYIEKAKEKGALMQKVMMDSWDRLFYGLAKSVMEVTTNMFAEDFIYQHYSEMRPLQYLSLMEPDEDSARLFTSYDAQMVLPPAVLSMYKSLYLAQSWYLKLLFGVNRLNSFRPKQSEFDRAGKIMDVFRFFRKDKEPGEEYDVKREVMEILNFNDYITFANEKDFPVLKAKRPEPQKTDVNEAFQRQEAAKDKQMVDMTMSMYMLSALQYFDGMPLGEVKKIAMQIAMVGQQGIATDKDSRYSVPGVDKDFSGYQLLAWYYVSWAVAVPEMVDKLGLPYADAYESARQLFEQQKKK